MSNDDEESFSEFDSTELHDRSCADVDDLVVVKNSTKKTRYYFVAKCKKSIISNVLKSFFSAYLPR